MVWAILGYITDVSSSLCLALWAIQHDEQQQDDVCICPRRRDCKLSVTPVFRSYRLIPLAPILPQGRRPFPLANSCRVACRCAFLHPRVAIPWIQCRFCGGDLDRHYRPLPQLRAAHSHWPDMSPIIYGHERSLQPRCAFSAHCYSRLLVDRFHHGGFLFAHRQPRHKRDI